MTTDSTVNAHVLKLQGNYLHQRLRGSAAPLGFGAMIEPDKRSRARILRELTAAGYLKPDPDAPAERAADDPRFLIDPSVYALIEAIEPDLQAIATGGVWGGDVNGVPVDRLTDGQKKWILDHPSDYSGTWTNGYGKTHPVEKIGDPAPIQGFSWSLWVTSPALTAWYADADRRRKIAGLFRQNLPHGLKTIAAIDGADAKGWAIADEKGGEHVGAGFGYSGLSRLLGHDPATWEADAAAIVAKAGARVQAALDELASVTRVQVAVSQVGGWAKIAEGLQEAVVDHVDTSEVFADGTHVRVVAYGDEDFVVIKAVRKGFVYHLQGPTSGLIEALGSKVSAAPVPAAVADAAQEAAQS